MNKYRIDYTYHSVYEWSEEQQAYLYCGQTSDYSKKELAMMENVKIK